jgi:hypothetical protein
VEGRAARAAARPVRPLANAKYVVFRCADSMESRRRADSRYYESVDLDDAYHVQTVLAYELNDQPLPVSNGAPLRCSHRAPARLQAREVRDEDRAGRALRHAAAAAERLLGRQRVRVVPGI